MTGVELKRGQTRAIVFDLFHTLVDPEDFRPEWFRRALRAQAISAATGFYCVGCPSPFGVVRVASAVLSLRSFFVAHRRVLDFMRSGKANVVNQVAICNKIARAMAVRSGRSSEPYLGAYID